MIAKKRFGRKISLPSIMEIRRDLKAMSQADLIVEASKNLGMTREEFRTLISKFLADGSISLGQARVLKSQYRQQAAEVVRID